MKKPFTVEEVKKMYFAQFDEIAWYIAHDKFKMNAIRRCLKENEKCYLGNLLETTKRYFSGSLRDFQKCGINTLEIKKEWEKVIDEIQKEIMNNKDCKIVVSVAICRKGTQDIITESATMKEAKKVSKENGYLNVDYWYLAAEVINEDGDTTSAVWDRSRTEAIKRLKKLL